MLKFFSSVKKSHLLVVRRFFSFSFVSYLLSCHLQRTTVLGWYKNECCSNFIFVGLIRHKKQWRGKGGLIWFTTPSYSLITEVKSRKEQFHCHITSTFQSGERTKGSLPVISCFLYSCTAEGPAHEMVPPIFRVLLPVPNKAIKTIPQMDQPDLGNPSLRLSSHMILGCGKLTFKIILHNPHLVTLTHKHYPKHNYLISCLQSLMLLL